MFPKWSDVDLGGLENSYALVNLLAWLYFGVAFYIVGARSGLKPSVRSSAVALYFVSMAVLARMTFAFLQGGWTVEALERMMDPEQGGFWGGPLWLVLLVTVMLLWLQRDRFWQGLDAFALVTPTTFAITKLACFCAGCCHGTATEVPWGLVFPESGHMQIPGVPIHPTQLYEVLFLLLISMVLFSMRHHLTKAPGALFCVFGLCYVTLRFILETLRYGDYFTVEALGLHLTQILELMVLPPLFLLLVLLTTSRQPFRRDQSEDLPMV